MTEDEYAELLRFLRSQIDEIGRLDVDQSAFASAERAERPSDAFFNYAASVLHQVNLESREGAQSATARLNGALRQSDGGAVNDIVLIPSDRERVAIDRDALPLQNLLPERSEFLQELGQLIRELQVERNESR